MILGFTLMGGPANFADLANARILGTTLLLGNRQSLAAAIRTWVRRWLQGSGLVVGSSVLLALSMQQQGTLQKPSQYALMGGFLPLIAIPYTRIDIQQLRRGFGIPVLSTL